MALIAAIAGAAGSLYSGFATSESASYQAQVASVNEQIANQNAQRAVEAGQQKAAQQGEKAAQQGGEIKAALSANNVDVNTGSALGVETGQRETGLLDKQTALNNSELEAYGYKTQATSYQAQSSLDTAESEEAPIEGGLKAAGSLLQSSPSVGFKWSNPSSANLTGSSTFMNWAGLG